MKPSGRGFSFPQALAFLAAVTVACSALAQNVPPVITQGATIAAKAMDEDNAPSPWTAPVVAATDGNAGDTLTWSLGATLPAHGTATVSGTGASPSTFTYAPTANWNGTDQFDAKVDDGNGGSDTITVSVTVNAINDMPVFTKGADQSVAEDAGAQSVANWATAIGDGDPEVTQTLTLALTNDNNALFSVQPAVSATGTLTYTPTANATGSASVSITLTDDASAGGAPLTTAAQTFTIAVAAANDLPSFSLKSSPNQTVNEDAGAQTVNNMATSISDGDSGVAQALTFTVTNTNNALFSAQPSLGTIAGTNADLTYTPALNANGSATVTVTLTDDATAGGPALTTAPQTFTITVTAVNDRPTRSNQPTASPTASYAAATHTLTLTVENTNAGRGTWADVDGSIASYRYQWQTSTDDSAWTNIATSATAASYVVPRAQYGNYLRCRIWATDNGTPLPALESTDTAETLSSTQARDADDDGLIVRDEAYYGTSEATAQLPLWNAALIAEFGSKWYKVDVMDWLHSYSIAVGYASILNPTADPDADNLDNWTEFEAGTHPLDDDTDNDGIRDDWELQYSLDPLDAADAADLTAGSAALATEEKNPASPYFCALTNLQAYKNGTDPTLKDTDGDGMPDGWEIKYDLAPLDTGDADGDPDTDGLTSGEEYAVRVRPGYPNDATPEFTWHSTNPTNADSDSDGLPDGWEVAYNLNPHSATGDYGASGDPDADTRLNSTELSEGTNPRDPLDTPPEEEEAYTEPGVNIGGRGFAEYLGGADDNGYGKSVALGDLGVGLEGEVYTGSVYSYAHADFRTGFGDADVITLANRAGQDAAIARQEPNGLWKWARHLVASSTLQVNSVTYCRANSRVLVGGAFTGTLTWYDLDQEGNEVERTLHSSTNLASFVLALESGNGDFLWSAYVANATDASDTSWSRINDVTGDESGNVYVCGDFRGTVTFNTNLAKVFASIDNLFIARLDATGVWTAANAGGGPTGIAAGYARALHKQPAARSIVVDSPSGKVYLAGRIHGRGTSAMAYNASYTGRFSNNAGAASYIFTGEDTGTDVNYFKGTTSWFVGTFDATTLKCERVNHELDNYVDDESWRGSYSEAYDLVQRAGNLYLIGAIEGQFLKDRCQTDRGLQAQFYSTGQDISDFPVFETLLPVATTIHSTIAFSAGGGAFSGSGDLKNDFAVRWTGMLTVSAAGTYGFCLGSDDGSRLYIDDGLVVDNPGLHGHQEVSNNAALTAGTHKIRIEFFEHEGSASCIFYWTPPGQSRQVVPSSVLSPTTGEQTFANPTAKGKFDRFIMLLNREDLALRDLARIQGPMQDAAACSLSADTHGDLYVATVSGKGGLNFTFDRGRDPDTSQTLTVSQTGGNLIFARLDGALNWAWATSATADGGTGPTYYRTRGAITPAGDRFYLTGEFNGTARFGTGIGALELKSASAYPRAAFLTALDPLVGTFALRSRVTIASTCAQPHIRPGVGTVELYAGSRLVVESPVMVYEPREESSLPDIVLWTPQEVPPALTEFYFTRQTYEGFTIGDGTAADMNPRYEFMAPPGEVLVSLNWLTEFKLTVSSRILLPEDHGLPPETVRTLGAPTPAAGIHWIAKETEVAPSVDGVQYSTSSNESGMRYVLTAYDGTGDAPTRLEADFEPQTGRLQIGGGTVAASADFFRMTQPSSLEYRWKRQYSVQVSVADSDWEDLPFVCRFPDPSAGAEDDPANQDPYHGTGIFWFTHGEKVWVMSRRLAGERRLSGWSNATAPEPFLYPTFPVDSGPDKNSPIEAVLDAMVSDYPVADTPYLGAKIHYIEAPVQITWNYGARIWYANTSLGGWLDLEDLDANYTDFPLADLNVTQSPGVRSVTVPAGSAISDMFIWDDVRDRYYPLRDGVMLLEWTKLPAAGDDEKVIIQVTSGFPEDEIASYAGNPDPAGTVFTPDESEDGAVLIRHCAATPAVRLDVTATDQIAFIPDRFYFSRDAASAEMVDVIGQNGGAGSTAADSAAPGLATGDAAVDPNGFFTCGSAGRAVLLFSKSTAAGVAALGDFATEVAMVRVVVTKPWHADAGWSGAGPLLDRPLTPVPIGTRISSAYDTAIDTETGTPGIHTGYVLFSTISGYCGNYNAVIYLPDAQDEAFGPVIPVNRQYWANPTDDAVDVTRDLVVVWYESHGPTGTRWGYQPVLYRYFDWPTDGWRIVAASRLGSEGLAADGTTEQAMGYKTIDGDVRAYYFDTDLYTDVAIYNQPEASLPGYNPNEEHALIAPSYAARDAAVRPPTAYALRNNLNVTTWGLDYTSDPYVLVQYLDVAAGEYAMKVYHVEMEDPATHDPRVVQELDEFGEDSYLFRYVAQAGQPIIPPYPLDLVIGVNPINTTKDTIGDADGTFYADAFPAVQRTYWVDHRGQGWIVSGGSTAYAFYFYPLRPDFWWPDPDAMTGDPIRWTTSGTGPDVGVWMQIIYPTVWPLEVPTLKAGETLTYQGGEYRADNPAAPGLPGVIGWAAGQIVYDDVNPTMGTLDSSTVESKWSVRLLNPLERRTVELPVASLPATLQPASGNVDVRYGKYYFKGLNPSLRKRVYYDPILTELVLIGYLNDRTDASSDLTAAPPAVYVLEPNVLTEAEYAEVMGLSSDLGWTGAVGELYETSLNPSGLAGFGGGAFLVGLQPYVHLAGGADETLAVPFSGMGPGLAVIPNQAFLDPNGLLPSGDPMPDDYQAYVTLAENNDDSLGAAPVALHIMKIRRDTRYRGAVKVIVGDNAFEERVVLRHTGDFGTHTGELVYQWFIREEDGTVQPLPCTQVPDPWEYYSRSGLGSFQVELEGVGPVILRDNLVFVRYAHENELNWDDKEVLKTTDWEATKWDRYYDDENVPDTLPDSGIDARGEWAGAGNSPDVDGNFRPQLVMGWVKRVLDAINPYEARIRDLVYSNTPATYVSMIQQFGPRYEGQVALNPAQNVVENVGLIELYQTVLSRAMDLSIDLAQPANTPGVTNAILLAATRLADFYRILGDEAWSDAQDPMVSLGTDSSYGEMAPSIFCFMNQQPDLLSEELALLRGVDDTYGRPVYNRLFWNFLKGQGESAYAANYNITDVTADGFVDEYDAMKLYPQGHGDAWGHYLTAMKMHYDLLRHPYFNWVSRSELYNLMDVVIKVDYFDERSFAKTAAAKARVGAQSVNLTFRQFYTESASGQWQGYKDTNTDRAWGVTEWARRAGQGALFDWITANAILPAQAPALNNGQPAEGVQVIDRATVTEIADVATQYTSVQTVYDSACGGLNPLGLDPNTVPFDINPALVAWEWDAWEYKTHFEQVAERADAVVKNALSAFDYAAKWKDALRNVEQNAETFRLEAQQQNTDFRNRLIAIFGKPHAGQIGNGKVYPAGYSGPDLYLYMYVRQNDIQSFTEPSEVADIYGDTELKSIVPWYFDSGDFTLGELYDDPVVALDFELPVSAGTYTYVAPEEWGERAAYGTLQDLISQMVQLQYEYDQGLQAYWGLVWDINNAWSKLKLHADAIEYKHNTQSVKLAIDTLMVTLKTAADMTSAAMEAVADIIDKTKELVKDAVPDKQIVGMANSIPIRPPVSIAANGSALAGWITATSVKGIAEILSKGFDWAKEESDMWIEFAQEDNEAAYTLKCEFLDFIDMMDTSENAAQDLLLQKAEQMQQLAAQYVTAVDEGMRLVEERANWHRRLAAAVQRERYNDMNLRVARNNALAKYNEAFDLAARYVYLTAKAYDYETNFDPNDPSAPTGIFEEVVRCRTLGAFVDGESVPGIDGLGDSLSKLVLNYEGLKARMGFVSPQTETGKCSLRRELARIRSADGNDPEADANWRRFLEERRVANLWDTYEFRRHCRPFAAYDPALPEPGIVIPFGTEIVSRKNFFGWDLAPGDHGYDPSLFATKIRSLGVWYTGYDDSLLAGAPRAYLLSVGVDKMAVSNSLSLAVRDWSIVNQTIPVPYPLTNAHLANTSWLPALDGLNGTFTKTVRHSSFRAYHDLSDEVFEDEMTFDSRLIGRSAWNTRWVLIIPGASLLADPETGLNRFIYGQDTVPATAEDCPGGVRDIKVYFRTYSHSGE